MRWKMLKLVLKLISQRDFLASWWCKEEWQYDNTFLGEIRNGEDLVAEKVARTGYLRWRFVECPSRLVADSRSDEDDGGLCCTRSEWKRLPDADLNGIQSSKGTHWAGPAQDAARFLAEAATFGCRNGTKRWWARSPWMSLATTNKKPLAALLILVEKYDF